MEPVKKVSGTRKKDFTNVMNQSKKGKLSIIKKKVNESINSGDRSPDETVDEFKVQESGTYENCPKRKRESVKISNVNLGNGNVISLEAAQLG